MKPGRTRSSVFIAIFSCTNKEGAHKKFMQCQSLCVYSIPNHLSIRQNCGNIFQCFDLLGRYFSTFVLCKPQYHIWASVHIIDGWMWFLELCQLLVSESELSPHDLRLWMGNWSIFQVIWVSATCWGVLVDGLIVWVWTGAGVEGRLYLSSSLPTTVLLGVLVVVKWCGLGLG